MKVTGYKKYNLPQPLPDWISMVAATVTTIIKEEFPWRDEAGRNELFGHCFAWAIDGKTKEGIIEILRASQEYKDNQNKPTPKPEPDAEPEPVDPPSRIIAGRDVFRDEAGQVWSWRGATMFLLMYRWANGEDIMPEIQWMRKQRVNVARVLSMVKWPNAVFNIGAEQAREFVRFLGSNGLRVEMVVFAAAQDVMPGKSDQKARLRQYVDIVGPEPNVFLEIGNEPWQNGVTPTDIWTKSAGRPCPMAYGDYQPTVSHDGEIWRAKLPVLDYLTMHTPRDADAWSRKAKDLLEMREGAGDGETEGSARLDGLHVPVVDDEPMGAAEGNRLAGRQRSNNPDDFFWHHAVAHIYSAGSTFHYDEGLQGRAPADGSDQQRCADAVSLVWSVIPPEAQTWKYTRSGLPDLPLAWPQQHFPEQTSRIYGVIGGNRAICVAVKPMGWQGPQPINGWKIDSAHGPQDSLVILSR